MSVSYHITDEPSGSRASNLIVHPFWPLLAMMLAGAWLGAPLFSINALLLRGPTWRREILLAAALLAGAPLIFSGLVLADNGGMLPDSLAGYAALTIVVWKLALSYWIFFLQQSPFALHEYFSGQHRTHSVRFGAAVVIGGSLLRSSVIAAFATPLWRVMVS